MGALLGLLFGLGCLLVVRARTGYTAGETVGRPLEIPSLLDSRNLER